MPLLDHFEIIAPFYDRLIGVDQSERLIDLIGLPISGRLLDAAGGTGRISQALRKQVAEVVVADLSPAMLRQAGQGKGLPVVCTATERLPFPDESFERIIMVDALHHVNHQADTASELWRVLKPGGRLVIEEMDLRTLAVKLVALAEKLALMRSHFLAPPRIANLFHDPRAEVQIKTSGQTAWVIVSKTESGKE